MCLLYWFSDLIFWFWKKVNTINVFWAYWLTCYVRTCKSHFMQKSFNWSEHSFWEIRGTMLTRYVGTCKGHLTDQNIFPEKSKTMHLHSMLEHTKVIWLIRASFLRNKRHCTHILYWNIQRSFDWSEHPSWEFRGTALTCYIGMCIGHLTDQIIFSKKIRGTGLTCYVGTCIDHLIDQNIFSKKSEALHSHPILEHAKVIWLIRTSFLRNQRHSTHMLCWNMQRSFD